MGEVIFNHPKIGQLDVTTRPDQIVWSYGLNTANYPTYGGEVVQILSAYIDDLTISGTIATYEELENIYIYFLKYIQQATAGAGKDSRNIEPMTMSYPHRRWKFQIIPKGIPGFKYGRDVIAPTWTMIAAVAEPDAELLEYVKTDAEFKAAHGDDFDVFGSATADIGYKQDNPFSGVTPEGEKKTLDKNIQELADFYNDLLKKYTENDFSALDADASRPSFLKGDKFKSADAK